jgi:type I restriction enzyme S subunit
MSGSIESRELLKKHDTEPLHTLTAGHSGGIFNGPQFVRNYVDDPNYGVPFLTTSSMLQADLTNLPLLSAKDAYSSKLSFLQIEEGMTLISCSGTVGRTVFARKDMAQCWSNQDIMKVVADRDKILPGYLYAFLSSRFGVPLVVSGTYGAIIQHIEPHHIADLPIPRLGEVEEQAHELVQRAAALRTKAHLGLKEASAQYLKAASIEDITPQYWHDNSGQLGFSASISKLSLRAMNYLPINKTLEDLIKQNVPQWLTLEALIEPGTLRSGPRFKRIDSTPEFGAELIGQGECFSLRPNGRWIAKQYLPNDRLLFPRDGTIMIAAQGCAGEYDLFGQVQFITGKLSQYAYSQHFLRVIARQEIVPRGALFAYLYSQIAYRIRKGYQIGSVQQDFHPNMISQMPVPIIDREKAEEIDKAVRRAYKWFDDAVDSEDEAISFVERAIEEGAR